MNKERLNLIVKNLELLVVQLKLELSEDSPLYNGECSTFDNSLIDYDEVFEE